MTYRVTGTEVKQIVNTSLNDDDLDPFINSANLLVTAQLGDEELTTAQLKDIELWVAAHFVAIRSPQASRERIGDAEVYYEGKTGGEGLKLTRYGQAAIALDPTGKLANLGRKKVSFTAIDLDLD